MITSNTTWHDMSREQWEHVLVILNKYMSSMRMVGTCRQYLQEYGRVPTRKQAETLQTFWNRSQGRKQYLKDLEQQESLDLSQQMARKFQSSRHVKHVPAEVRRYDNNGEVERTPIGFKQKVNLESPTNRYTLDTSIENIKKTRLERFDALFNDN